MNDILLLVLTIIGLFALYWVLVGQWKHNKMLREAEMREKIGEMKESALENKKKKSKK